MKGILGIKKVRTEFGTSWTVGGRVVLSRTDKGLLLEKIWARMFFERDVRVLKSKGVALPEEAFPFWTGRYRIERVRLGDLHPMLPWLGSPLPTMDESPFVRYLRDGRESHLEDFARHMVQLGCGWRMEDLAENVKAERRYLAKLSGFCYDPSVSCIVIDENGVIIDGQHRVASLFFSGGGDREILVVRAFTSPVHLRLCRYGR